MEVANNAELADILCRGNIAIETLSATELIRFSAYWQGSFFSHQNVFFQHKNGYTGHEIWMSYSRNISQYMKLPGVYQWWQRVKTIFDKEFVVYINAKPGPGTDDSLISEKP